MIVISALSVIESKTIEIHYAQADCTNCIEINPQFNNNMDNNNGNTDSNNGDSSDNNNGGNGDGGNW